MIQKQQSMMFSSYMELYNLIVPEDNILRRINDLVDFSFVYDELQDKYCLVFRRSKKCFSNCYIGVTKPTKQEKLN
ncbi:hypothetical protein EJA13_14590 [Bacillus canaveralius]|nr:hypothetical protein EJA13_14590 [Bacillus canaveralius]